MLFRSGCQILRKNIFTTTVSKFSFKYIMLKIVCVCWKAEPDCKYAFLKAIDIRIGMRFLIQMEKFVVARSFRQTHIAYDYKASKRIAIVDGSDTGTNLHVSIRIVTVKKFQMHQTHQKRPAHGK